MTIKQPTIDANLAEKLRNFAAGQVVRCSRTDFARVDALLPAVLQLVKRESGAWKGYMLEEAKPRAQEAVRRYLRKHQLESPTPEPKTTRDRQLAYLQRSAQLGRKKLAVFLEPEAAQDLDYLAARIGGKKAAVEQAIADLAKRMRSKDKP